MPTVITEPMRTALGVRYVKCHFTVTFMEDTRLPKNKVSMLRGGMGEMLLRANCVRDRRCEVCDFEGECVVQRTMYSKMEIQPDFMSEGNSVGYVLECEDYHEYFEEGDAMKFSLTLFGKTIVYFSQFLQAFHALGMNGAGAGYSRFVISSITNSRGEDILENGSIRMDRYRIQTLGDYADYRLRQLSDFDGSVLVKLQSPLALKYKGELQLDTVPADAFSNAVLRRIYMLDCYEGIRVDPQGLYTGPYPEKMEENLRRYRVPRYSNRTDTHMAMDGIEGEVVFTDVETELLPALLAGEILHIGRQSSFGFGRYRLSCW